MSSGALSGQKDAGRFPWVGMLALAAAAFLAVTSEALPTGLLPELADGLQCSTPAAGLLVSFYALTVVVATTPLAMLTRRIPRRPLLIAVIVMIGLSSVLLALSPNYAVAVVARITGGMAHGVFWAVSGGYVGRIATSSQLGRAVAITAGGVSLAFIFGVPLATILGHAVGWRIAFAVVGCLLVAGAAVVGALLPRVDTEGATAGIPTLTGGIRIGASGTKRRADKSVRPAIVVCVLTGLITLGYFTLNAYIAPFIADAMGFGTGAVGPLLFVGGVMGAISVVLVGTRFGRTPNRSAVLGLVLTAVAVAVLAAVPGIPVVAIGAFALWSIAFGCLPPLLQTALLTAASARFRDTASALYTTAFNLGIGGGGAVGGAVYAVGGVYALPWAALAILVVAIVTFAIAAATGALRTPDDGRAVSARP